jgi:hypothetical protein
MPAMIYQPTKTSMQSGRGRTKKWLIEFTPHSDRWVEPLMGWTSSDDMPQQISLEFDNQEQAVAFAIAHYGDDYIVVEPKQRKIIPKSYAENFN